MYSRTRAHVLKSFVVVMGAAALALIGAVSTVAGKDADNNFGNYLLSSETTYISMDLDGAKLSDVLKLLSKKAGLNFVPTEAVRNQKVTLYLENVPLDETLTTLFETYKLTYEYYPDSNIFVVKEKASDAPDVVLKTKVYYLKYARIKSTRLAEEIKGFTQNQTAATTGTNVLSPSTSSTSTTSSSDTAGTEGKGLKEIIEKVLTKEGKVTEEPRMNALIVTDHPYQFAMIDSVVEQLDRATPKVLIEVEVLDVVKTLADKLGFAYDSNGDGVIGTFTAGSLTTAFPFSKGASRTSAYKSTLTPGSINLTDLNISLKLIKTDTRTKILARPKILTLSNETAEIKIVTDAAIGLTSTTSTTTGTTTSVERQEVGTKLRVTPQVNPDTNEITLYVEASVQGVVDSGLVQAGLTGNIKNPTGRQTRAVLRLKNGETLMMGGLISKEETKGKTKLAFLGDIPVLGAAFRSKATSSEDREMLVFITPRLVNEGRDYASIGGTAYPPVRLPSKVHRVKEALDRFEQ